MGALAKVVALEHAWANFSPFMKCSEDAKPNGQILNGFQNEMARRKILGPF
jgi:hypothetical protein